MSIEYPIPLGSLQFAFQASSDWADHAMSAAFRLRGMLGKGMRQANCIFDVENSPCNGCSARMECFYGNGFETPNDYMIEGFGKVGSLPQLWSLQVENMGLGWRGVLWLAGNEVSRAEQWQAAVVDTGLPVQWLAANLESEETLCWQATTPIRLRVNGRNPAADALGDTIAATLARKIRMLAAMHGLAAPEGRLPSPQCESGPWVDIERFSFRHSQQEIYGGWMPRIKWPDDLSEHWQSWLALLRQMGVGRQTTFGFGQFICIYT